MMENNQLTMRTYMAIMAERDAAIQERNLSLEERKRAFAERDMAMLQRDAAIAERNSAIQARDGAISALRLLESSLDEKAMGLDTTTQGEPNYIQQQMEPIRAEAADCPEGNLTIDTDTFSFAEAASETVKPRKVRQRKESKVTNSAKSRRVENRAAEGLGRPAYSASWSDWDNGHDMSDDEQNRRPARRKDSSNLKWIVFDESVMPTPVCTCTGSPQPCYRWGNGGWQSACCTTTISMYPLPQVSNKRYTRVGGRKMSGSAFSKLLNRLASSGHDLSVPLDLKDHWAKHGTNRYTTVK